MYSGASLTNGYGMQYRENFVHHSLEVPGLHGRGGIYFGAISRATVTISDAAVRCKFSFSGLG